MAPAMACFLQVLEAWSGVSLRSSEQELGSLFPPLGIALYLKCTWLCLTLDRPI